MDLAGPGVENGIVVEERSNQQLESLVVDDQEEGVDGEDQREAVEDDDAISVTKIKRVVDDDLSDGEVNVQHRTRTRHRGYPLDTYEPSPRTLSIAEEKEKEEATDADADADGVDGQLGLSDAVVEGNAAPLEGGQESMDELINVNKGYDATKSTSSRQG